MSAGTCGTSTPAAIRPSAPRLRPSARNDATTSARDRTSGSRAERTGPRRRSRRSRVIDATSPCSRWVDQSAASGGARHGEPDVLEQGLAAVPLGDVDHVQYGRGPGVRHAWGTGQSPTPRRSRVAVAAA